MKRWKKTGLVVVLLLILSQVPFACRHYKLSRLRASIEEIRSLRQLDQDNEFSDYKGVIHVHSFLGGHSTGTFEEIIRAAKTNDLSFVVMTEHASKSFNTAQMTLSGMHDGIIFINGNELKTTDGDRLLVFPGNEAASVVGEWSTKDLLARIRRAGALAFVTYPQEFRGWDANDYEGVETYNLYTNARDINPLVMFFDGLWSYHSYPDLLFATFYARPTRNLELLDQTISLRNRKLVMIAGNDAHANIGLTLSDSSGKTILGIKLDPYERSFQLVRVHVLLPVNLPVDSNALLRAIAEGHCFIGFDLFGDSTGFRFSASTTSERKIQGDEIQAKNGVRLDVNSPVPAHTVLLKDGKRIEEQNGTRKQEFFVNERGSYRVEVYLPQLPPKAGDQPWILSNPIYVR